MKHVKNAASDDMEKVGNMQTIKSTGSDDVRYVEHVKRVKEVVSHSVDINMDHANKVEKHNGCCDEGNNIAPISKSNIK